MLHEKYVPIFVQRKNTLNSLNWYTGSIFLMSKFSFYKWGTKVWKREISELSFLAVKIWYIFFNVNWLSNAKIAQCEKFPLRSILNRVFAHELYSWLTLQSIEFQIFSFIQISYGVFRWWMCLGHFNQSSRLHLPGHLDFASTENYLVSDYRLQLKEERKRKNERKKERGKQ